MNLPAARSRATTAALVSASALILAGCAAFSDDAGSDSGTGGQVAAAFYPLQYVAERVAGEFYDVENLTPAGKESHDLELTIKETAVLSKADLVVFEKGYQPGVDEAVEQNATGETLDVAEVVELLPPAEHDGEEHHDDEHAEEEHAADDGHDHGDLDPHFWQDPVRMADLGDAVAEKLAELNPDHQADYTKNAKALRSDLETLDGEYTEGLKSCERDVVVVSHDAFGYLAKYGLHLEPIAGLSPDAEPTPAGLADLQHLIEEEGVTTVFYETLVSPKFAQTLADDAGAEAAVLDPVEGLTDDTAGEDYLSLMRSNLAALEKANGC
ncbi:metal ABC transporter substrate-binding protein [Nocardioides speluncae]|uniref:metal ABC transporter substrate-binding protein n=1 Tax=Nocardioides speluncae TaxID=2670337 RepID=UPI000D68D87C|nr:metal ABC transporter substrate-binding protein [Nocardioides speluncae]